MIFNHFKITVFQHSLAHVHIRELLKVLGNMESKGIYIGAENFWNPHSFYITHISMNSLNIPHSYSCRSFFFISYLMSLFLEPPWNAGSKSELQSPLNIYLHHFLIILKYPALNPYLIEVTEITQQGITNDEKADLTTSPAHSKICVWHDFQYFSCRIHEPTQFSQTVLVLGNERNSMKTRWLREISNKHHLSLHVPGVPGHTLNTSRARSSRTEALFNMNLQSPQTSGRPPHLHPGIYMSELADCHHWSTGQGQTYDKWMTNCKT